METDKTIVHFRPGYLGTTLSELIHLLGNGPATFMETKNYLDPFANLCEVAKARKEAFIAGLRIAIEEQLPEYSYITYAYLEWLIKFAEAHDWTRDDHLEQFVTLYKVLSGLDNE